MLLFIATLATILSEPSARADIKIILVLLYRFDSSLKN